MRLLSQLFLLLLLTLAMTFAFLNADPVFVNYYLGLTKIPLSLLLAVVLTIGAFLGLSAAAFKLIRYRREITKLQRRIAIVETELSNLRTLPLDN